MIEEIICYAILYAVEALIGWLYFEYLFAQKKGTFALFSAFLIGYTGLFGFSLLNNTTVNATAFCIVNYYLLRHNYQCNIKTAILHSAFLCFTMVSSEIIVALWISVYGYEFSAYTYNFRVMVLLTILSKLLYLLLSAIGSRILVPHKRRNEEPRMMILFCVLPLLSSIIAIVIVSFGMIWGISGMTGIMTIIIVVILLVVNLMFFALYNDLQKTNAENLELQLSVQKERADILYYSALQEQAENQRIIIHDIKKHLGIIDALAKRKELAEIEAYISELGETFLFSNQAKLCANPILNLLLLRFRDDCKERNVQFYCDVRENSSDFLDASSATTLYGNLLSNALETAETSSSKQIELSVKKNEKQSIIIVSVMNSCDSAPEPDGNGGFQTSKEDRLFHGVGLKSINRIVAKYNGVSTMYFDPENKQFHHVIQFPEPN